MPGPIDAAGGGLETAAGVAGDVVRAVVPEFVTQYIPFLTGLPADILGVVL